MTGAAVTYKHVVPARGAIILAHLASRERSTQRSPRTTATEATVTLSPAGNTKVRKPALEGGDGITLDLPRL